MAGLQDPRQSLVQWRLWQVRPQQLCLYFDVKQKHVLVTWTWAHFSWVIFVVARSSIKSMFCACCWFWKDHHLYYLQLNLTNKNHPKYCTSADVYSAAGFEPSAPLSHQCKTFKHTFQMTTLVFLSLAVGQEKKKITVWAAHWTSFSIRIKNYPESDKLHSLSRNLSDTDTGYQ